MNRLPLEKRAAILEMLVEGMSMRSITRVTGHSINTVSKLLRDYGQACRDYHDQHVRGIEGRRTIQCDEIWSYVYVKAKRLHKAKSPPPKAGTVWTWTALEAESKMIIAYGLSRHRDDISAINLMLDIAERLEQRPRLMTDALSSYHEAAVWVFGRVEHSMAKKTAHVERQNLTMRMGMRRFTRKSNGFSKRFECHLDMLAIYFIHYNFARIHGSIRCSPAMALGVDDKLRDMRWLASLVP